MEFKLTEQEMSELASKIAEIGIKIPLDNYIFVGVITLISAGVGAYIGAYLKKKGEIKGLNENFSNLTSQLEVTTRISEEIKGELAKSNHVFNHKFESYHAKQIESIEGLYEHLIALEKAAKSYISSSNDSNKSGHGFKAAREAAEKFILYSNLKEMWIPSDLYTQISELSSSIDTHVYSVLMKVSLNKPEETPAGLADFLVNFSTHEALDLINNKVPLAKSGIVNKVRELLDPTHS
jgi:hypothetical protein